MNISKQKKSRIGPLVKINQEQRTENELIRQEFERSLDDAFSSEVSVGTQHLDDSQKQQLLAQGGLETSEVTALGEHETTKNHSETAGGGEGIGDRSKKWSKPLQKIDGLASQRDRSVSSSPSGRSSSSSDDVGREKVSSGANSSSSSSNLDEPNKPQDDGCDEDGDVNDGDDDEREPGKHSPPKLNQHGDPLMQRHAGEMQADGFDFDGIMHLQTLKNLNTSYRKIFRCRKDPYIQIVSGLKDPDIVLTVQLRVMKTTISAGMQKKASKQSGLIRRMSTSKMMSNIQGADASQIEKKVEQIKVLEAQRQIQNEFELSSNYEKILQQFQGQNQTPDKYVLDTTQTKQENQDKLPHDYDKDTFIWDQERQVEVCKNKGNALTNFPQQLGYVDKNSIEGEWQLEYTDFDEAFEKKIIVQLNKFGAIQARDMTRQFEHNIQGSIDEARKHLRWYSLQVNFVKLELVIDEEFQSMSLRDERARGSAGSFVFKAFSKVDSDKKHAKCKVHALVKLWRISDLEQRVMCEKSYAFCDPDVQTYELEDKQEMQRVIYTTVDGDAYLFKGKRSGTYRVMYIIDQSWPMGSDLPIDTAKTSHVNKKMDTKKNLKISQFLLNKNFEPVNQIQNQMLYFNSFAYLAHSTKNCFKVYSMQNYTMLLDEKRLEDYKCVMLLSIDAEGKLYILGRLKQFGNKAKRNLFHTLKRQSRRSPMESTYVKGELFRAKFLNDLQQQQQTEAKLFEFAILKYDPKSLHCQVYPVEKDSEKKRACSLLTEAYKKYEIRCMHEQMPTFDLFVLEFSTINALIALKIEKNFKREVSDYSEKGGLQPQQKTIIAEQFKQVTRGKHILLIRQNKDQFGQRHLWSLSEPSHTESDQTEQELMKEQTISLRSLLTSYKSVQRRKLLFTAASAYNKKLSYAATLTSNSQLIFGMVESQPGSYYKGISLIVEHGHEHDRLDNRYQHLSLSRVNGSEGEEVVKNNKKDSKEETSQEQIDDFKIEYPIIVYIEDDESTLSLCNLLQPQNPQCEVTLKNYAIKKFVGGTEMIARHQTAELFTHIAMLVQKTNEPDDFRLMVLYFNPFSDEPLQDIDTRMNVSMGKVPYPHKYQSSRVKCAELITQVIINSSKQKKILQTVVLQFANDIYACFMTSVEEQTIIKNTQDENDGESQQEYEGYIRLNTNNAVKLKMIRGYNQNLYFAETDNYNRTDLVNVFLDQETEVTKSTEESQSRGVMKEHIYSLQGCQMIGLEIDTSNVQDDKGGPVRNSLFIIDSLHKIHHLWKDPDKQDYQSRIITLGHHKLNHMSMVPWSSTPICDKIVQYSGVNYCIKTACKWKPRSYSGRKYRDFKLLKSQVCPRSQLSLSINIRYDKGSFVFVAQPAPSTKRLVLTHKLSTHELRQMVFVTNNHLLVSMNSHRHKLDQSVNLWAVFNIRNCTLVKQVNETAEPWSTIRKYESDFSLACTDFSNIDDHEQRLIVMRCCEDRSKDSFVLKFDNNGQMNSFLKLDKQPFAVSERGAFPLQAFRIDNELEQKPTSPRSAAKTAGPMVRTEIANSFAMDEHPESEAREDSDRSPRQQQKHLLCTSKCVEILRSRHRDEMHPGCVFVQHREPIYLTTTDAAPGLVQQTTQLATGSHQQLFVRNVKPKEKKKSLSLALASKLVEKLGQRQAAMQTAYTNESAFEPARFVGAFIAFKVEEGDLIRPGQKAYIHVKACDSELKPVGSLCKYAVRLKQGEEYYKDCWIYLPESDAEVLAFSLEEESLQDSSDSEIKMLFTQLNLFCEDSRVLDAVKMQLLLKEEDCVGDVKAWKKQSWTLDPDDFTDPKAYCLPTLYKLAPLIYTRKRLVVTIGEVDLSRLPEIHWRRRNDDRRTIQDKFGMIVQKNTSLVNNWTHVNLVIYSNQSKNVAKGKVESLANQAVMVGDIIYLCNVHSQFRKMMKITIEEKVRVEEAVRGRASSTEPAGLSRSSDGTVNHSVIEFDFTLSCRCREFDRFHEKNTPVAIDRLKQSWISKLQSKKSDKRWENQPREKYKDALQVNFLDYAVLFNIAKDTSKSAKPGDLYAEEISQMENVHELVENIDNFLPIGFVPTFFTRERQADQQSYKIHKTTVIMNGDEDHFFVQKQEFNSETQVLESTTFEGPFKMFTEYDLENILHMQKKVTKAQNPKMIDFDTISAFYCGQNLYSIFYDDEQMLHFLAKRLTKVESDELHQIPARQLSINLISPIDRSRQYQSNKEPTHTECFDDKQSIFKWSFNDDYHEQTEVTNKRELLLQIALQLPELRIDHIIDCIEDLIKLIEKDTPISREIFDNAPFETNYTRKITEIKRGEQKDPLNSMVLSTTCINNEQRKGQIENKIAKADPDKAKWQLVELKIVSLRWMFQDGLQFCDLVSEIISQQNRSYFNNNLIQALFQTNWIKTRSYIIWNGLMPFICYFLISIIFTEQITQTERGKTKIHENPGWLVPVSILFMFFWAYFAYIEFKQMLGSWRNQYRSKTCCQKLKNSFKDHLSHWWNWLDAYLVISVPIIILTTVLEISNTPIMSQKMLLWSTCFLQVAMWIKLFDWLRLFRITSIYPILLYEIFVDMYPFLITVFCVLGIFGNSLSIFSSIEVYDGYQQLFSDLLPYKFGSAFATVFMTMTGTTTPEAYYISEKPEFTTFMWVWLILAIVMTNIVFMNVLIAIISDTFARVWEQRATYILSSQAYMISDWLTVIPEPDNLNDVYLYMVTPQHQQDSDHWEGQIHQIKKLIDNRSQIILRQGQQHSRKLVQQHDVMLQQGEFYRQEANLMRDMLNNLQSQIKSLENNITVLGNNITRPPAAGFGRALTQSSSGFARAQTLRQSHNRSTIGHSKTAHHGSALLRKNTFDARNSSRGSDPDRIDELDEFDESSVVTKLNETKRQLMHEMKQNRIEVTGIRETLKALQQQISKLSHVRKDPTAGKQQTADKVAKPVNSSNRGRQTKVSFTNVKPRYMDYESSQQKGPKEEEEKKGGASGLNSVTLGNHSTRQNQTNGKSSSVSPVKRPADMASQTKSTLENQESKNKTQSSVQARPKSAMPATKKL